MLVISDALKPLGVGAYLVPLHDMTDRGIHEEWVGRRVESSVSAALECKISAKYFTHRSCYGLLIVVCKQKVLNGHQIEKAGPVQDGRGDVLRTVFAQPCSEK